jgi:glycosyltransferase involved in cell wall biosynthesis
MISICTKYRRCDATHAAIAIKKHLDSIGIKSTLLHYDWRAPTVDPAFDSRVHRIVLRRWLRGIRHTVWTSPIDGYFIETMRRKKNIRSTLFTSWEQLEPYDEKALDSYQHVLVPTMAQAALLQERLKLKNIAVLPYKCGYPIIKRKDLIEPGKLHICMSLYGNQLKRIDLASVLLFADIVKDFKHVFMEIICSKGLSPITVRELNRFQKKLRERWKLTAGATWWDHAQGMARADLTIWPAKWDGMGLAGLTSLHMGTPVIAWDVPPMSEYLSAGRNALLVSCGTEPNWMGIPHALPNHAEFDRVVRWLIGNPAMLKELQQRTHEKLEEFDGEFERGLDNILPD